MPVGTIGRRQNGWPMQMPASSGNTYKLRAPTIYVNVAYYIRAKTSTPAVQSDNWWAHCGGPLNECAKITEWVWNGWADRLRAVGSGLGAQILLSMGLNERGKASVFISQWLHCILVTSTTSLRNGAYNKKITENEKKEKVTIAICTHQPLLENERMPYYIQCSRFRDYVQSICWQNKLPVYKW